MSAFTILDTIYMLGSSFNMGSELTNLSELPIIFRILSLY